MVIKMIVMLFMRVILPTVPNSMTSGEMRIAFPDAHRIAPKLNRVMYGLLENNLS